MRRFLCSSRSCRFLLLGPLPVGGPLSQVAWMTSIAKKSTGVRLNQIIKICSFFFIAKAAQIKTCVIFVVSAVVWSTIHRVILKMSSSRLLQGADTIFIQ